MYRLGERFLINKIMVSRTRFQSRPPAHHIWCLLNIIPQIYFNSLIFHIWILSFWPIRICWKPNTEHKWQHIFIFLPKNYRKIRRTRLERKRGRGRFEERKTETEKEGEIDNKRRLGEGERQKKNFILHIQKFPFIVCCSRFHYYFSNRHTGCSACVFICVCYQNFFGFLFDM